jgi:hypothetical protein
MMEALVQLDPKGNGRVPLSTFYSQPPSADYQFKEAASALAYFQSLTSSSSSCEVLKAGNAVGLKVPDTVVQQWLRAKITEFDACKCWAHEKGELAFQMYNMKALTMKSDVCLLQADPKEPLNPYGCLMSLHEDGRVIAAVSDFDAFLIGSSEPVFEALDSQQVELAEWCLDTCPKVCQAASSSWARAWLHMADKRPRCPMPPHGYGDKVSTEMIEELIEATKPCGRATRHGMEAFNYAVPVDFDDSYVVYWGQFASVPYRHMNLDDLCTFLLKQARDGFHFPLNPAWMRDARFAHIFKELQLRGRQQWFPIEFQVKIRDAIDNGFRLLPSLNAIAAYSALPLELELDAPWEFEGMEPKLAVKAEFTSPSPRFVPSTPNQVKAQPETPSPARCAASQPSSGGRSRTPPGTPSEHVAQHRHARRNQHRQRWRWDPWHQWKCATCAVEGLKCWYNTRPMCPKNTDIALQHYVRVSTRKITRCIASWSLHLGWRGGMTVGIEYVHHVV